MQIDLRKALPAQEGDGTMQLRYMLLRHLRKLLIPVTETSAKSTQHGIDIFLAIDIE